MRFLRAARAALAGRTGSPQLSTAVVVIVILAGLCLCLSCSNNAMISPNGLSHNAYVSLPRRGSVQLLQINNSTGIITLGAETPQVQGTTPTGLALTPSKKFLYAVNSQANTISVFNVGADGTLTLTGTPTVAGSGPDAAAVDPSGKYLLVTNNFSNDISVFSIDAGSGALTQVGSPVPANTDPSEILIMPSGQFVYVTNPQVGVVSAFSFSDSDGTLQQITGSPFISGAGALGLALDASQQFLYVANPSASNLPPFASTIGNISGFSIDSSTGALSPVLGSPFTSAVASSSGPLAITVDPGGRFVYGFNSGTSTSVWCFIITPATGQLLEVKNSPFSEAAGGVFALIDPTGNFLYTGTATGVAGYTYNSSTGVPTVIAGSVFATGPPGKMVLVE